MTMRIGIRAWLLMDEPAPDYDQLDQISDDLMDGLLDAEVEDPAVSVDFDRKIIEIEAAAEGAKVVDAFARGRQRILEVIHGCGVLVGRMESGAPTQEPEWGIVPEGSSHTRDDLQLA